MIIFFLLYYELVPASPPQNVMAIVLSSTEIQVNWTAVPGRDQNGEIIMYDVCVKSQMTINRTVMRNNTNIILSGLEEFEEYQISVRAHTRVGPGPYSAEVAATTLEDGKLSLADCTIMHK